MDIHLIPFSALGGDIDLLHEEDITTERFPASLLLHVPDNFSDPVSHILWLSEEIVSRPLCGGLGLCGRCRLRFLSAPPPPTQKEESFFSREELDRGFRLGCQTRISHRSGRIILALPDDAFSSLSEEGAPEKSSDVMSPPPSPLGLAVDVGTTTLAWAVLALDGDGAGKPLYEGTLFNPQGGVGSDVISRLQAARDPEKRNLLSTRVREALVRDVGRRCPFRALSAVCLAANTAMTDIFLDRDVSGLCAAPYRLSHTGHEEVCFSSFPPCYIPPLLGPFVGGDVSAGIAFCLGKVPPPWLLIDLGTNAEFALLDSSGRLFVTSVPMGPAMEGIGMRCGQVAGPSVITRFALSPNGLAAYDPSAALEDARGISASGYFSLLALLRGVGVVRADGQFERRQTMPLCRKIIAGLREIRDIPALFLPQNVVLTLDDIEAILKVKASFSVALAGLTAKAGCSPFEIKRILVAGALGAHVSGRDLEALSFLPKGLGERVEALGNTSLKGAGLLLCRPSLRDHLAELCHKAVLLQLTEDPGFEENFFAAMRF
ncbi:MAG: ASKHA domain-containing protein [Desulfovibrio sp.]|nr:ASKHA domain-containing protein [Desulfovibrio sp.]